MDTGFSDSYLFLLRGKLFGGTVPPNNTLFGGTVPPNSTLFGGTPNFDKERNQQFQFFLRRILMTAFYWSHPICHKNGNSPKREGEGINTEYQKVHN